MPANSLFRPACCRPGLPSLALAAVTALWLGMPAANAAKPAKAPRPDGTPVEVTAEMIGAGIVSSGVVLPPIPPVTGSRLKPVPSWGKPLPYPIIIADRRNNRLIEIAPDKRVVWEFASPSLKVYRGNEDVNFSADGKLLAVSEEDNYDVHIVDYETRTITWTYGVPDTRGHKGTLLNYPDDSHLLADGKFLTADIRNCRVLIIDPKDNRIATQWGEPGKCKHDPPRHLAYPNGATPMANGDILVTEITDALDHAHHARGQGGVERAGAASPLPLRRLSHGRRQAGHRGRLQQARARGHLRSGHRKADLGVLSCQTARRSLDHPSIARELPDTGDILVVDDLHDRVLVIDRTTKDIIWQYGVTGVKGHEPGKLNYPDGVDIDVFRDWKASLPQRRP